MVILAGLSIICGVWAVTASLLIVRDLEKRGIPVNYIWLRLMLLKYLHQYSKITQTETGHVGPLFYHYIIPLNVALVLAIVMAIVSLV
jgi:hypothetical protein